MSNIRGTVAQYRGAIGGLYPNVVDVQGTPPAPPTAGVTVWVKSLADFPAPVANVITLPSTTSYFLDTFIDLGANRLACAGPVTIFGSSSETCGLSGSVNSPMITSNYSVALKQLTIQATGIKAIDLDGTGQVMALDWSGVNFLNSENVGDIRSAENFIFDTGSFLGSSNLVIDGTLNTVSLFNSLFRGADIAAPIIALAPTATVLRRFRMFFCSVSAPALSTGIQISVAASIPTESLKFDQVNFAGAGIPYGGVLGSSNKALFTLNTGIANTSSIGGMAISVTAPTAIANVVDFFQVQGTVAASSVNERWTVTNPNRLTCNATIRRRYSILFAGALTTGANNQVEVGFYASSLGGIIPLATSVSTASGGGRAENISTFAVLEFVSGDYLEVHVRNLSSTTAVTMLSMIAVVSEI